jgi:hypothetical protein
MRGHFDDARQVDRRQAESNGHFQRERALPQPQPRRAPEIRRAVRHHRQGQRQAQPAGQGLEPRAVETVQAEIKWQRHQHDVAKAEGGQADLQPGLFAQGRRRGFLGFAQRQLRFIADGIQQRRQFAELDFIRRKRDGGFAAREIDLRFGQCPDAA